MARVLTERGFAPERLVLDEASSSTADNVAAAARQVETGGHSHVIACSDGYHLPRVRMLLALHGVRSQAWPCRRRPPLGHGVAMGLRECAALPHNLARLVVRRLRRRS